MNRLSLLAAAAGATLLSWFSLHTAVSASRLEPMTAGFVEACLTVGTWVGQYGHWLLAAGAVVVVRFGVSLALQVWRTRRRLAVLSSLKQVDLPPGLNELVTRLQAGQGVRLVEVREPLAFCHGLSRPELVVSTGLVDVLSSCELEAVLRHELAHARNLDPLRIAAARSFKAALSPAPLGGWLSRYLTELELKADKAAVEGMGEEFALASALHRLFSGVPRLEQRGLAMGAFSATSARIEQLAAGGQPELSSAPGWPGLPVLLGAVLVLCVLASIPWGAASSIACLPC